MRSRARGALWLLGLVLFGRFLDALDLPFESTPELLTATETPAAGASSAHAPPLTRDPSALSSAASRSDSAERLDLQTATLQDLKALPGVGPVLAARIVAYREAHGVIRNLEELQRVQGIGARTAQRLAPMLRFPAPREEKSREQPSPEP